MPATQLPANRPVLRLEVIDDQGRPCGHTHYSHHSAVNCRRVMARRDYRRHYQLRAQPQPQAS